MGADFGMVWLGLRVKEEKEGGKRRMKDNLNPKGRNNLKVKKTL